VLKAGEPPAGSTGRGRDRRTVTSVVPCRADLAGGTLDIWPLGVLHQGSLTVNVAVPVQVRLEVDVDGPAGAVDHAIGDQPWHRLGPRDAASDLTAAVCFELRPGGGARVRVLEQAPFGSGLGGSSSYAVALARSVLALEDRTMDDRSLVALLRDLEARVLSAPTGVQDHWAAVCGGALAVHMEPGGERVESLAVDLGWLADRFSIFCTGLVHHSGMVNWQVIRRRLEGDDATISALSAIAEAAARCRRGLLAQDEAECREAIAAEWEARKRLAPEVCPPEIERLERVALAAGASAVKACGAGGGGSLLLWHGIGARECLSAALSAVVPDGRMLRAGVSPEGCRVHENGSGPGKTA
jgi:D-glycero-alpha-D-manno-heptose-7-phosphate kinase